MSWGKILVIILVLMPAVALADAECEKRIRQTGMIFAESDPQTICRQNPPRATQDCLVEVLNKTRGKLRNSDLFAIFGTCRADSRPLMRDCLVKGMSVAWNDPKYRAADDVGSDCLLKRKSPPLKSFKETQKPKPRGR